MLSTVPVPLIIRVPPILTQMVSEPASFVSVFPFKLRVTVVPAGIVMLAFISAPNVTSPPAATAFFSASWVVTSVAPSAIAMTGSITATISRASAMLITFFTSISPFCFLFFARREGVVFVCKHEEAPWGFGHTHFSTILSAVPVPLCFFLYKFPPHFCASCKIWYTSCKKTPPKADAFGGFS